MAPKFALFTKGSKLPLNKGFKNMFELYYSLALNPRYVDHVSLCGLIRAYTFEAQWKKIYLQTLQSSEESGLPVHPHSRSVFTEHQHIAKN